MYYHLVTVIDYVSEFDCQMKVDSFVQKTNLKKHSMVFSTIVNYLDYITQILFWYRRRLGFKEAYQHGGYN